jgi:hypothetical protein
MAGYSTEINRRGPFVFDRAAIRSLCASLRKFLCNDRPVVSFGFVGDHSIESDDIDSLIGDDYVSSRRIVKIKIGGTNYHIKPSRSATITLSSEYGVEVRASIGGDRDPSLLLRNEIESMLESCTPWYARLYLPAGHTYDGARLAIGFTICWVIVVAIALLQAPPPDRKIDIWFLLQWSGSGVMLLWAWLFINRRMFPRVLFDIGKSADQVAAAKYWRNTVFVGVVLAVIAGVVATLITDRLKG